MRQTTRAAYMAMASERTYASKSQVQSPGVSLNKNKIAPFSPTSDTARYSSQGESFNQTNDSLMMPSTDVHIRETDLRKAINNPMAAGSSARVRNTALQFAPNILEQTTGGFTSKSSIYNTSRRNFNMTQIKRDNVSLIAGNSTQVVQDLLMNQTDLLMQSLRYGGSKQNGALSIASPKATFGVKKLRGSPETEKKETFNKELNVEFQLPNIMERGMSQMSDNRPKGGPNNTLDLKKYLESKVHTREALNHIKAKMLQRPMEPGALSRDPQYGTTKNTAINMHQFIKATPRSNILKAARLIQNR